MQENPLPGLVFKEWLDERVQGMNVPGLVDKMDSSEAGGKAVLVIELDIESPLLQRMAVISGDLVGRLNPGSADRSLSPLSGQIF